MSGAPAEPDLLALMSDRATRRDRYGDLVRAHYAEITDVYAAIWGGSFHFALFRSPDEPLKEAVRETEHLLADLAGFRAGMEVLDVGCGRGGPALEIGAYSGAHVTGVDIVPRHIEVARRRAAARAGGPPVRFEVGDAVALPFADSSFDAVYVFESGCHAPDKSRFYEECYRVLRPGGPFVGFEWLAGDGLTEEELARWVEPICRCFACPDLISLEGLRSHLLAAGFAVEVVEDAAALGDVFPNWRPLELSPGLHESASYAALARLAAGGRALAEAAQNGAFLIGHWRAVKPAARVSAPRSRPPSAEKIAASLGLSLEDDPSPDPALRSSQAVVRASSGGIDAVGAGETRADAVLRALMEHAERTSLAQPDPPIAAVAPFREVRDRAISPRDLGLYRNLPEGVGAFSDEEPLEWVEVEELGTGERRLVPVEFVFLRAPLSRLPLVAETSSGTAASFGVEEAIMAALCEVIERDAFMLFWYRQPRTTTVAVSELPPSLARDDLHAVQELGYVVVVCRLDYDLGVPCVLLLALRGAEFAYGLGCRPTPLAALGHAVRELGARVRWVEHAPPRTLLHRPLATTTTPSHHYELYHRGPLASVLRNILGRTLEAGPWLDRQADVPARVRRAGFRPYHCEITTEALAKGGIRVVRALVPGLIPLHFGFDRLRLGCERLTGDDAPGRLATLLPHFLD